ncbi:MAG: peptide MFS transporter [Cytophagaceae bacterium]|jgi:POT family proton-dependent oligopeptide transporter|nr:peptide MFS transporter [Cytophagaceae bacterium]
MDNGFILLISAWLFVAIMTTFTILTNKKYHPRALFYLFFVELWERFSYYGMRALLMLYMVKGLLYTDTKSSAIYAAYVALVYSTPVLGGLLAEKIIGSRMSIVLGAILMAIGHLTMAVENDTVFLIALGFLIVGNGFFKPNISSLIGKLYHADDKNRDSGFTIFYMGINSGAFLAPITCGYIGETYSYHYGFAIAGIGMLAGLIIFWWAQQKGVYEDKGLAPINSITQNNWAGLSAKRWVVIGSFLLVPVFTLLIKYASIAEMILYAVCFGVIATLLYMSLKEEKQQREKLWVILVLFVFTTLFWTFFELAGSAITLFTERNVDRTVSGLGLLPTSLFQAVNPLFIIMLAPLFSLLWEKLPSITIPQKFALAMFQIGIGFMVLVWAKSSANGIGLIPVVFLVLMYLFHTTAELCLSPIGLSLVSKLSPQRLVAFIMGIWLLSATIAGLLGGMITNLTSQESLPSQRFLSAAAGFNFESIRSLDVYLDVFNWIAWICIAAGVLLTLLSGILKRWMHGVS